MKLQKSLILLPLLLLLCSFAYADLTTDNQAWVSLQDGNFSSFDLYGGVKGVEGVEGGAFEFNSASSGYMSIDPTLSTLSEINISFKTKFYDNPSANEYLFSSLEDSASGDDLRIAFVSATDKLIVAFDDGTFTDLEYTITNFSKWYDIEVVHDGSTAYLYVDKNLEDSVADTFAFNQLDDITKIGERATTAGGEHFNGQLDEFYISSDKEGTTPIFYSSMDSLYDWSANNNSFEAYNGVTYDAPTNSYDFDGTDDYILIDSFSGYDATEGFICSWINMDAIGFEEIIASIGDSTSVYATFMFNVNADGTLRIYWNNDASGTTSTRISTTSTINANEHFVCAGSTGTEYQIYIDGVDQTLSLSTGTNDGNWFGDITNLYQDTFKIGVTGDSTPTQYFDGQISGVSIYNRTLSSTEVAQLYAEGKDYNPYLGAPPTGVYIPKVTEANQIGTATITSTTYTPIFTGQVNVTNIANISATLTGSVFANAGGSIANCNIEIDGVQKGYTITSPPNNEYRSIYAGTNLSELGVGTHNITANCKSDGSASFDVTNLKLLMTQYVKSDGTPLNTHYQEIQSDITSSDWEILDTVYFTTTNLTLDEGTTRYVVFEASTNFEYDSTGTICLKATALNESSADFCRYGGIGTYGSGSTFAMSIDVPANVTIPINIWGKSTTSNGHVDIGIDEFEIIAHDVEIVEKLIGVDMTSSDWEVLSTSSFSNEDHISISSVAKGSFAVKSNVGASDMEFRFRLTGDEARNGTIIYRDVTNDNREGIVTLQEVFEDLPLGDYNLVFEAKTSNSDATITGGQIILYTANEVPFEGNTFNITAIDKWSSEQITCFSASLDGLITISDDCTGLIQAPIIDNYIDVEIIREGHPSKLYENHNVVSPLEAELGLNYVRFYDADNLESLVANDVTVNLLNGTILNLITDINGTVYFEDYSDSILFTFEGTQGYITPVTFNYTASETPYNISYGITRTNIIINIYDGVTEELILQNADIIITNLLNINTSTGTVNISNQTISAGEYSVYVKSDGYVTTQKSFQYTSQDNIVLNIFMINSTGETTGNLFVLVYDDQFQRQPNVDVRLQAYYESQKDFIEVSQCFSDSNGECVFPIELGDRLYKVIATSELGGNIFIAESSKEGSFYRVDNTQVTLFLNFEEDFILPDDFSLVVSIYDTELINDTTTFINADFLNPSGSDVEVCIGFYYFDNLVQRFLEESCTIASSGTVEYEGGYYLDRNYTYIAKVYQKESGNIIRIFDTVIYAGNESFSESFKEYLSIFIICISAILIGLAVRIESIELFAWGILPLASISSFLAPLKIGVSSQVFIMVICSLLIWMSRKEESNRGE